MPLRNAGEVSSSTRSRKNEPRGIPSGTLTQAMTSTLAPTTGSTLTGTSPAPLMSGRPSSHNAPGASLRLGQTAGSFCSTMSPMSQSGGSFGTLLMTDGRINPLVASNGNSGAYRGSAGVSCFQQRKPYMHLITEIFKRTRHDGPALRYRTDLDKHVIHFALRRFPRCVEVVDDDDITAGDWHFFWMSVGRVRSLFSSSDYRLTDQQIINHFPNHYELTRKDLMYKNIKKYIRDPNNAMLRMPYTPLAGAELEDEGQSYLRFANCVPVTYNIPNDIPMFEEEYRRQPGCTWIVKPTSRSQGRGIFLINKIAQLKKWLKERKGMDELEGTPMNSFVVSKYILDPFLIGGKKFDLRLYVLVTSFKPLVAYLHRQGFARFCATRYAANALSDEDLCSHLTNVALQKGEKEYNASHGGKWSLDNLLLFIQGRYGAVCADGLLSGIEFVIYHSLRAMESVMFNDRHCFELYGYDILIDSQLRPHLIEVNASPSLSTTTPSDRVLKEEVLRDVMQIVFPPDFPSSGTVPYWEYRLRTDITTALPTGFRLLHMKES